MTLGARDVVHGPVDPEAPHVIESQSETGQGADPEIVPLERLPEIRVGGGGGAVAVVVEPGAQNPAGVLPDGPVVERPEVERHVDQADALNPGTGGAIDVGGVA